MLRLHSKDLVLYIHIDTYIYGMATTTALDELFMQYTCRQVAQPLLRERRSQLASTDSQGLVLHTKWTWPGISR
jgi:hypothetical protein